MNYSNFGDLSAGLINSTRNTMLKNRLSTLTNEMGSGKIENLRGHLNGSYTYLLDIDRALQKANSYTVAAEEAALTFDAGMRALDRISSSLEDLSSFLLLPGQMITSSQGTLSSNADTYLRASMEALNGSLAGKFLFAGQATDAPPLASADDLLNDLRAAVAGIPTAAGVISAAQAWFDSPAGYDATIYQGSTQYRDPLRTSVNQAEKFDLKADDAEVKSALKPMALMALLDDPTLGWSDEMRIDLIDQVMPQTIAAQSAIVFEHSGLGFGASRVDAQIAFNKGEAAALEISKSNLISADPYETALDLQRVQVQLDSFYSILARSSSLSLVNYL